MKAQPRSRRPGLGGLAPAGVTGSALRVAVTDPPEDGRANRAVAAALAAALHVAPSAVTLAQGAGARLKIFRVAGDPAALSETLRRLTSA